MREVEPIAYTIADAVEASGVGRTKLYEVMASGQLDVRKCGKRVLITADSLRSYIAALPTADLRLPRRRTH